MESGKNDVKMLLSYCDDLVRVLRDNTDVNNLKQCLDYSREVQSCSSNDLSDVKNSIRDCQNKIDDCKKKIEEAKSSMIADEELDRLEKQLDEELQSKQMLDQELGDMKEKININQLDQQRLSIEERNQNLEKLQQYAEKADKKLSFYASVTNVIPDLQSQSKIAGQIVERDKQMIERFDIDPTQGDTHDICISIWKMINL
ncbi:hypothetical protein Dimus_021157 [Dionaea muscipula]